MENPPYNSGGPPPGGINPNTVLLITSIASFSTPFTLSSVNVALPAISRDLNMSALELGWVSLSFLLASSVLLVPLGRAADIYGRKKIFASGFIIFTAASLFCALSQKPWQLISFRVLQGFGSSMIFGTGIAILTTVFPASKRGRALGVVSASVYLGLTLGPFLGGILVQGLSWRSIFYLNVPVGLLVLYLIYAKLKTEWKGSENESFDLKGSIIYSLSLAALMYGLSTVPRASSWALMAAGFGGCAWFLKHELSAPYPVLNARLFLKNKAFIFANLAALLNYCACFALSFLLSLYLQYVKGFSPSQAGFIMVFQPVFMVLFSPAAGRLSDRIEPRLVSSWGMALTAAGLLFFSRINALTPISVIIAGLCVLGTGLALFSAPNTNAVMGSVEQRSYSLASALLATMRVTGQLLSMAIVMLLFSLFIGKSRIGPENLDQLAISFRIAVYIFTAMSVLGVFTSLQRGNVIKPVVRSIQ
ncbi:MAG: MFS transporter [Elusimicrobia bacterium]|nr:MFS transporter [Elusimicrobiota bacterium]